MIISISRHNVGNVAGKRKFVINIITLNIKHLIAGGAEQGSGKCATAMGALKKSS